MSSNPRKKMEVILMETAAGNRVRLLRRRAEMTQRRPSEYLGVSGSTICAWERGRSRPSRLARIRLAEYEAGRIKKPITIVWTW